MFNTDLYKSMGKYINYGNNKLHPPFSSMLFGINDTINICSKCISMFPTKYSLEKHMEICKIPFKAIYEEKNTDLPFKLSKIESLKTKQLLSIISEMFIKNKTVYYEVQEYDFYIIYDKEIIGYFSRYKNGDHSLNCFLVFPCFQKQGWGTILMDISSLRLSEKPKSPEKPYTKKAIMCFRKYWKYKVIGAKSIAEISKKQNITVDDAIIGLELNGFNFKKWKLEKEITVEKPRLLLKRLEIKKE